MVQKCDWMRMNEDWSRSVDWLRYGNWSRSVRARGLAAWR